MPPAPPIESFAGTGLALPPLVSLGRTPSGAELRALRLPADELLPWWHRVRAVHATIGHWPVLLGADPGDLFRALPAAAVHDYDPADELARAATQTAEQLHARRRAVDAEADLPHDEHRDAPAPASVAAGPPAHGRRRGRPPRARPGRARLGGPGAARLGRRVQLRARAVRLRPAAARVVGTVRRGARRPQRRPGHGAARRPAAGHPGGGAGSRAGAVRLLPGRRRAGGHGHAARRGPGRPVVLVLLVGLIRRRARRPRGPRSRAVRRTTRRIDDAFDGLSLS